MNNSSTPAASAPAPHPLPPRKRRITPARVIASLGILVAVGGFVGATWFAVTQALAIPVATSVQRGLDDLSTYAESLDGIDAVASAQVGQIATATPNRDGYLVLTTTADLPRDEVEATASLLSRWLTARETISQVRLHVALDVEGSQIGLAADQDLNTDRFTLLWRGLDATAVDSLTVLWTDPGERYERYNIDTSNDALAVTLVPNPGVDTTALRGSWHNQLREVSPTGRLVIDETSALPE